MLSSLVKEHQARQVVRKEQQEAKKKEALTAANSLTTALVDHLNVGVAQASWFISRDPEITQTFQAYLNQKRLDSEAKQLHLNATNFSKQTAAWLQLIDSFNDSLKEVGDVESWAKTIETDMQAISSTLEYAYKVNSETAGNQGQGQ